MLGIEPVIEKLRTLENATLDRFVQSDVCICNFYLSK